MRRWKHEKIHKRHMDFAAGKKGFEFLSENKHLLMMFCHARTLRIMLTRRWLVKPEQRGSRSVGRGGGARLSPAS